MKVHIQIDHEMQVAVNKGRGNKQREMYITVACQCGKVFVNELDYQVREWGMFGQVCSYVCSFLKFFIYC